MYGSIFRNQLNYLANKNESELMMKTTSLLT